MRSLRVIASVVLVVVAVSAVALANGLPPGGTFVDDDGHTFEGAIEAIAAVGITQGCNPPTNNRFCPDDFVTRGEMAVFLVRAMGYADNGGGDLFVDDDGLFYEGSADRLKTAKVTLGCNPPANDRYCGERDVTRGQMAAFLSRALELPAYAGPDRFVDDNGHIFEGAIERLAEAKVTLGCNPPDNDRFCPDDRVTRGQMAAFLARGLGLSPIYPPRGSAPYLFGPHIGGAGGWEILDEKFTGAHFSPAEKDPVAQVKRILNAAQADGKSVVLLLARSGSHYQNPDGTFSLEKWKAAIDQFASIDFSPWVADGTFLAHYLVSEPMAKNSWGGKVITAPVLDEMARYSKQYWPKLTTAVREHPTDLLAHAGGKGIPLPGWEWTYLDTAWARYSADKGQIEDFISEEVAAAKSQKLGLIFGMNVLDGGDGSSDKPGVSGWTMSVEELLDYGPKLIEEPYGCAMLMWHYRQGDTGYFDWPEIDAAMTKLARVALDRGPFSCLAP